MAEPNDELRQRKYPRVKERCQVKYRVVPETALEPEDGGGVAVNISGGGMCLSTDEPVKPGSMIAVEMSLADLPTPVISLGRVVWCERVEAGTGYEIGVEFWWIGWADEEAQRRMLEYVRGKLDKIGRDKSAAPD